MEAADVPEHVSVFLEACARTIELVCARRQAELQRSEQQAADALEDSMKSLLAFACRARLGVDSRRKRAAAEVEEECDGGPIAPKRGTKLPDAVSDTLTQWFLSHVQHPYPTSSDRAELAAVSNAARGNDAALATSLCCCSVCRPPDLQTTKSGTGSQTSESGIGAPRNEEETQNRS